MLAEIFEMIVGLIIVIVLVIVMGPVLLAISPGPWGWFGAALLVIFAIVIGIGFLVKIFE